MNKCKKYIIRKTFLITLIAINLLSCSNKKNTVDEKHIKSPDNNLVALVSINNKYGYISTSGEYIIQPQYPLAFTYSNSLACVNIDGVRDDYFKGIVNGYYTFINIENKKINNKISFSSPTSFYNNFAIVNTENNKWGFINKKIEMIAEGFDNLFPFKEGLAAAMKKDDNKVGYIDTLGNWKITFDLSYYIGEFSNGYAFYKKNNLYGFINKKGETVIKPIYDLVDDFSENYAACFKNNKWGFINKSGNLIIPNDYDDVGDFSEGLCAVKKNDKWGYIDTTGKNIIPFTFNAVRSFHEGFAAVQIDNKVGFIKKNGSWLLEPQFESAFDFKNGYAIIQKNNKLGFINDKGEIIISPQYDRADNFVNPDVTNEIIKIN